MCDLLSSKAGDKLADGYAALVYILLGEHDYKRDNLRLKNINSANCCNRCTCNRGTTPWFDFSLYAKFIATVNTEELQCPLFADEVGITRNAVWPDWMHDKYLGTDKVPGFLF